MGAAHISEDEKVRIYVMASYGMTGNAIARIIGRKRDSVARALASYTPPPMPDIDADWIDERGEVDYWPRIAPPPPSVPAAVALDYRLTPRERALRQHGRVK